MDKYKIYRYETIDSTMKEAIVIQNDEKHDFVVITNVQTNGKGRFDRVWATNRGDLMFTLSLNIKNIKFENLSYLNFICSLSIVDAIEDLYDIKNINIKWPNDILVNLKKISGVLLEVVKNRINIGVGVNIENCPYNVLYPADFLKNHSKNIDKEELFQKILSNIYEYIKFVNYYGVDKARQRWKEKIYGMGKIIYIRKMDEFVSGTFIDINEIGNLIVNISGNIEEISAGDVFFE